ncbi:DNA-cytosine methyltransferase family protein [Desulfovibrio sp. A2]|nr:DNA-cytosine methyltransferase family protein [Desulfovibrio sp. A2]
MQAQYHLGFLDFFAGSGLVTHALSACLPALWANDISEKKAAVYTANHGTNHFQLKSITDVQGAELPPAILSWASFPCQDLSLAGQTTGIHARRSGLVWEWLRVMDEMPNRPPLLVAENVPGLVSTKGGTHYQALHHALQDRGYRVGAVALDALRWLPQSRQRIFVIAANDSIPIPPAITDNGPNWLHSSALCKVAENLSEWVWWKMPEPQQTPPQLQALIQHDAPHDTPERSQKNIALIPDSHMAKLRTMQSCIAAGYKRMRGAQQRLELRFDGVAGCLRTPRGGSSRQYLIIKKGDKIRTRLLTVREAARLMGAPEDYKIPGSYNDGYQAMGDAVAVPVARFLATNLLTPLTETITCNC